MGEWKEGDVLANGIRMHYTRTGTGRGPDLVLLHGYSDNGRCWTPVAQALEADYDIVMIDARGHGLSEAPEEGMARRPWPTMSRASVMPSLWLIQS